uniref:Uncharacterized protein n=1 Tax=Klebsiella phage vB_KpnM_Iguana_ER37 TaxID=3076781 RepID=A0AB38Z3M0_9CAUD
MTEKEVVSRIAFHKSFLYTSCISSEKGAE